MMQMTTDVQTLRIGMVGVGGFGGHRRGTMRQTGLFNIVAAADHNEQALAHACEKEGAEPAASYDAMIERDDLDAVVISTGASSHAEMVLKALDRGLPVFVEKPVCCTWEEIRHLLRRQRETGLPVHTGHGDPETSGSIVAIHEQIRRGALGEIVSIEATTAHSGGFHIKPGDWRGDPDKNPGGMLFQCGVHKLHELHHHFGPVTQVFAMTRNDIHETGTDDSAQCLLRFESGLTATLNAYHLTAYRHSLTVYGTKATVHREDRYGDEGTRLWLQEGRRDGGYEPREALTMPADADPCGNVRKFHHAVCEQDASPASLEAGVHAVAVTLAATESAKTGRVVDIPSPEQMLAD